MRDPSEKEGDSPKNSHTMNSGMQEGPTQPGTSLASFLQQMQHYEPTIPDAVANNLLLKNGVNAKDPRVVRLLSLATQKFISDIALDAMQQARIKGLGQVDKGSRETRFTLTAEMLKPILREYGFDPDSPSQ